ncbi:gp53-like domain-containing protein (plasmid) [Rahnella variigena]|uniref:gp53-like domain-containing protein n=1 Tax=Rahnella variigena TaxID=574964 RepID=UPI003CF26996
MNRADAPKKQPIPFGVNGQRESLLPTTPAGDNTASYDAGFPPVTMILKAAGGLPPKGQDMNQILYELSTLSRWASSGALNSYDASFSSSIAGYPKAAVLVGDDGASIFISTSDGNLTNPNSGGAGWFNLSTGYLKSANNLSEIFTAGSSAQASARTNLGLGNSATLNTGSVAGTVATGNDSRIVGAAQKTSNLSDLANAATARSNLGLGTAATATVGTGANQIPSMASFTSLLSQNGWFKLPSGIIVQWGASAPATPSSPDVLVNFPIPFPNGVLTIGEHDRGGSAAMTLWQINNLALSGFYASVIASIQRGNNQVLAVPQSAGCQWWALGY